MFAEAIPLRSTTVDVVALAVLLLSKYISRHDIPTALHSDRGGSVHTADLIKALYKLMGIKKTVTTSYRPQSNGGCDRFNGTLKELCKIRFNPKDLKTVIIQCIAVQRGYNNQSRTSCSILGMNRYVE